MPAFFSAPRDQGGYHDNLLLVKMRAASAFGLQASTALRASREARSSASTRGARRPSAPSNELTSSETRGLIESLTTAAEAGGMSFLARLERAGRIRRAIPLGKPSADRGAVARSTRGALSTLAALAASRSSGEPAAETPLSGTTIVELERSTDIDAIRTSLAEDAAIEFVERVPRRFLFAPRTSRAAKPRRRARGTSTAATAPGMLWNLEKIQWRQARARAGFQDAAGVKVAVLDTGVDRSHPDLASRIADYTHVYPGLPGASGEKDFVGHGTHVAGTIAAGINNNVGINGVCTCDLHVWKIFADEPKYLGPFLQFGYEVDPLRYLQALGDCLEQGMDVINLSIGGPEPPSRQEEDLFAALIGGGTTIVAATGNEREFGSPTSYPAAIGGVIAVGATNIDDTVAIFSSAGAHMSVAAPGAAIWSTMPTYPGQSGFRAEPGLDGNPRRGAPMARERNYYHSDGTSMAAPHVAAAAALVRAKHGPEPAAKVKARLESTADRVPAMGSRARTDDFGAGRLNLLRLLA